MDNKAFTNLAVTPLGCHLWKQTIPNPDLKAVKQYSADDYQSMGDDSSRGLKQCLRCEQLYFCDMSELIDMEGGEDSMYRTYIPVATEQDADKLSVASEFELYKHTPQLVVSWPSGEDKSIGWVKDDAKKEIKDD